MFGPVIRILWYMLSAKGKTVTDKVDGDFYYCWFRNIMETASKITRKSDGYMQQH